MTDYNDLSIEELVAVVESLPDGPVTRADLSLALKGLLEMRILDRPSTEELVYAMRTGDCSRLGTRSQ